MPGGGALGVDGGVSSTWLVVAGGPTSVPTEPRLAARWAKRSAHRPRRALTRHRAAASESESTPPKPASGGGPISWLGWSGRPG
jgi:hypothetical protein